MSKIDLRPLLDFINPKDLKELEWVEVGMALQTEGYSAADWDSWSAREPAKPDGRYTPGDCEYRWKDFREKPNGVTGAFIVELAKKGGWKPKGDRSPVPNKTAPERKTPEKKRDLRQLPPPLKVQMIPATMPSAEQRKVFLQAMFRPGEHYNLIARARFDEGRGKWDPAPDRTVLDRDADIRATYNHAAGAWFRPNPVVFPLVSTGTAVADADVAEYRHALVECDEWSIKQQVAVYRRLRLPVSAIVYSGGKSAHAFVRIGARDKDEYRTRVGVLYDTLESYGVPVDTQNKNPSRAARLPGFVRGDQEQRLLYLNTGLETWDEWTAFIEQIDQVTTTPPDEMGDPLPSEPPAMEKEPPAPPELETFDAAELETLDVKDPEFIVQGLIPVGLTVLAAPVKFGKSWFSLQLCLTSSEGKPFLDWETRKCDTLYLALEDSKPRMKKRIALARQGKPGWPSGFRMAIESKDLNSGLVAQLEKHIEKYPNTRLFIVDTLQKVRGPIKGRDNAYAVDYAEAGRLKEFADAHNVAVIAVTHTRKMRDDSDWVTSISGTTGIVGCADTILCMLREKREDQHTHLHYVGRDVDQGETVLYFDAARCTWDSLGDGEAFAAQQRRDRYNQSPMVATIRLLLERNPDGWTGSASDFLSQVQRITGKKADVSAKALKKALDGIAGDLWTVDGINYSTRPNGTAGQWHIFTKELQELPADTETPFTTP